MVNTATLYRSPVRLVKHAFEETETYSPQAISRARKKLMAEIALSGDEILIDDLPYSRNDASTLLDAVTEADWKVHSVVFAHKGLLDFLEKEEFKDEELKKADAYLYNEGFVRAVSPFFAHSFNSVSGRLVKGGDFETAYKLLNYGGYILPEHSGEAYQKIRTYLDDLLYTLRNLSWEKFIADESILHFVFDDGWRKFLNKLPSSFTSLRDEVVEQLTAIVLRFQHKATWYYLHEVLVRLKGIETNEFNRSEVVRIDEHIYRNSQMEANRGKSSPASDSGVSGRAVWWVLWVILTIVRMATCNDRSSDTNFGNTSFTRIVEEGNVTRQIEKTNEKKLVSFLDSLSGQENKLRQPLRLKTGDLPFPGLGEDMRAARNDSVLVTNNTGYDAAVLYFKDIPGHYREGMLPKIYTTYIRAGESETVYVLPNNGRLYFAFGERWGRLKKPLTLTVSNPLQPVFDSSRTGSEELHIDAFFSNTKKIAQPYLKSPVLVDDPANTRHNGAYVSLHDEKNVSMEGRSRLVFSRYGNTVVALAYGPLSIKQEVKFDVPKEDIRMAPIKDTGKY